MGPSSVSNDARYFNEGVKLLCNAPVVIALGCGHCGPFLPACSWRSAYAWRVRLGSAFIPARTSAAAVHIHLNV